jgi:hypothetical protein
MYYIDVIFRPSPKMRHYPCQNSPKPYNNVATILESSIEIPIYRKFYTRVFGERFKCFVNIIVYGDLLWLKFKSDFLKRPLKKLTNG